MQQRVIELKEATLEQKPILANLLELYSYEFTSSCDFDIGDDGLYGYKELPLYWEDDNRFPYLIYVDDKIAGLVLVQKALSIAGNSDKQDVWDIAEFFIMYKYKKQGIGTRAVIKIWQQFKGDWQVRVLLSNPAAQVFWSKAIEKFTGENPAKTLKVIKDEKWNIFNFKSIEK